MANANAIRKFIQNALETTSRGAQDLAGEAFSNTNFNRSFLDVNSPNSQNFRANLVKELGETTQLSRGDARLIQRQLEDTLIEMHPNMEVDDVYKLVDDQVDAIKREIANPPTNTADNVAQEVPIRATRDGDDVIEETDIRATRGDVDFDEVVDPIQSTVKATTDSTESVVSNTRKIDDVLNGHRLEGDARVVLDRLEDQLRQAGRIVDDTAPATTVRGRMAERISNRQATPEEITERIVRGDTISESEFKRLNDATMQKNTAIVRETTEATQKATTPQAITGAEKSGGAMDLLKKPFQALSSVTGTVLKWGAGITAATVAGTWLASSGADPEIVQAENLLENHLETNIATRGDPYKSCALNGVIESYAETLESTYQNSSIDNAAFNTAMSAHMGKEFLSCAKQHNAYGVDGKATPAFSSEEEAFIGNSIQQLNATLGK